MAFLTFLAIVVALIVGFKDEIRRKIEKPILDLEIKDKEPCYTKTSAYLVNRPDITSEVYYFRAKIMNNGKSEANNINLYLKNLEKWQNGSYKNIPDHNPMNFLWSNTNKPVAEIIHPNTERYCDMMVIYNPKYIGRFIINRKNNEENILKFNLEVDPNNLSNQQLIGIYRATVILAADNVEPQTYQFEIEYNGWDPDPQIMFKDKLIISHLNRIN